MTSQPAWDYLPQHGKRLAAARRLRCSGVRTLRRTLTLWAAALTALGVDCAAAQIFANTNADGDEQPVLALSIVHRH